jgi:type II secretion system protein I
MKSEKGFTLIEVMVALVVLALITMPLLRMFTQSVSSTVKMGNKTTAISLAKSLVEEARLDLASVSGHKVIEGKNFNYTVVVEVENQLHKIIATVEWDDEEYSIVTYKGGD